MSSKMTENAIEDGSSLNDHVIKSAEQFPIGGILIGGNDAADRLTRMWKGFAFLFRTRAGEQPGYYQLKYYTGP